MANSHKEIKDNLDKLNSLEDVIKPPKPLGLRKFIIPLGIRPLQCSNFYICREKASTQIQLSQSVNQSIPTAHISESKTANSTEFTFEKTTSTNENIVESSYYREKIPQLNKALKIINSPIILNSSNINTAYFIYMRYIYNPSPTLPSRGEGARQRGWGVPYLLAISCISKYVAPKDNSITFDSSSPQAKATNEKSVNNHHQPPVNTTINSKPTKPSSWSSVAELVGDVRATNQSYSKSNLRNLTTILRNSIPYQSTKNNSPSNSNSTQNNSINVTSIGNNTLIQRNTDSVTEGYTATLENQREGEQGEQEEKNAQTDNNKNFEILAREIYSFIRQRLQLERERRGNSYSGRLP